MQDFSELFDDSGKLKPGVQIIPLDEDEGVGEKDWNISSSTKPCISCIPHVDEEKPTDWLDDSYSGDLCDLRNLMRNQNVDDLVEFLKKTDRRRILQIREHLLQVVSYNAEFRNVGVKLILLITRCTLGDFDITLDDIKIFTWDEEDEYDENEKTIVV